MAGPGGGQNCEESEYALYHFTWSDQCGMVTDLGREADCLVSFTRYK